MFSHCAARKLVRASSLVGAPAQTAAMQSFDPDQGNMIFVCKVTGRTAGSVTTVIEGALSAAGPWVPLAPAASFLPGQAVQAVNGLAYIELFRESKPYIRCNITPAGGFDGSLQIDLATDRMFDAPKDS